MKNLGDKWLMMIEPSGPPSPDPIDDEITQRGRAVLASAREGVCYRGFHICTGCPLPKDAVRTDRETTSGTCDLLVRGPDGGDLVTNSLLVHYLRFHRAEVPEGEIEKLMRVEVGDGAPPIVPQPTVPLTRSGWPRGARGPGHE